MLFKCSQHLVILHMKGLLKYAKIKAKAQDTVQSQDIDQNISMPVPD